MSTAPRFIHQLLATRIIVEFSNLVSITHEKIEEILNKKDEKFHGAPEIVIEILSPGRVNAGRDLQIKRELYEIFQAPEYRVINPFEKEIVVFRMGAGGLSQNRIYREDETLKTPLLPRFKLKIKNLFAN